MASIALDGTQAAQVEPVPAVTMSRLQSAISGDHAQGCCGHVSTAKKRVRQGRNSPESPGGSALGREHLVRPHERPRQTGHGEIRTRGDWLG